MYCVKCGNPMNEDHIQCSACGHEVPERVVRECQSAKMVGTPDAIPGTSPSQSAGSYTPSKEKVLLYTYFPRVVAVSLILLLILPHIVRILMILTDNSIFFSKIYGGLYNHLTNNYKITLMDIIYLMMVIVLLVISIRLIYCLIKSFLSTGLTSYDYCDKAAIMIIILGALSVANSFDENRMGFSLYNMDSFIKFSFSFFLAQQTISYMMIVGGLGLRFVLNVLSNKYHSIVLATKEQSQSTPASIATGQFCTNCLSFNTMHRSTCYKCGSELNGDAVIDQSLSWHCKYCANENGSNRQYCSLCKRKREED